MIVDKKIVSWKCIYIDSLKYNFGHFWPKLVHLTNKFVKKSSWPRKTGEKVGETEKGGAVERSIIPTILA